MLWINRGATGIGKETALQLVRHNATVYIASRSRSKFDDLRKEVLSSPTGQDHEERFQFLELDLSSIESCILAAREFKLREQRLDVVIANAALAVAVS